MTFIAARRASDELKQFVKEAFSSMGEAAIVEERLMNAATALSSCGIAYAYKYVQACVQAGVQLGFRPDDALHYVLATVDGAVAMLRQNETLPQQEIDRVTTPGGMTIKGINELDHQGFTSAVIRAILKPLE
jgi:pyrroline-5-carboxylate reductase